jgi:FtsP/CotA-like multicopper oxidase with cupredoxin domain
MITRRHFLSATTAAGAGLIMPWGWVTTAYADAPSSPPLTHFVDPLPIPSVLQPKKRVDGVAYYEVVMSQFFQKLHRDLPPTTLWGYNGTYPGPTIVAQSNRPIVVKWINHLPTAHLFPIDHTLPGMSASLNSTSST